MNKNDTTIQNINDYIGQYRKILGLFFDIGIFIRDSQKNASNDMEFLANGISFKIYNHFVSILKIVAEPVTEIIDNKRTLLIDISSLDVLTRASFETYLTFNHIFIQTNSIEEQKFRFDCWI